MKNENLRRMLEDRIRETEQAITMAQAMMKAAGDIRHAINKSNLVMKAVLEDLNRNEGPAPDKQILDLLDRTQATARQLAAQAQQSSAAPAQEDHHHHDHEHTHGDGMPSADELFARCSEEELNNRRTVLHLFEGPDNIFTRILASTTMRGGVGKINAGEGFPSFREDISNLTERQFMNPAWATGFYRNSKSGSTQFLLRTEDFVLYCLDLNEPLETMKLGIFMINGMPEDLESGVAGKPVFARWICYKSMHYVLTKVCKMFGIPFTPRALVMDDGPTPSANDDHGGPTPA